MYTNYIKDCGCDWCNNYRNNPYNFMEIYGAKLKDSWCKEEWGFPSSPFKVIDDYCKSMKNVYETTSLNDDYKTYEVKKEFKATIKSQPFPIHEEAADWLFGPTKKNRYKGKDNNMTNVTISLDCDSLKNEPNPNQAFYIQEPKFKVGDKVVYTKKGTYASQLINGVISRVETNIKFYKTDKASKYQRDANHWLYDIKTKGGTYNNVSAEFIVKDNTPEFDKYFDFLDKQGVKLDRTRYTWKSFSQVEKTLYPNYLIPSGVYFQRDLRYAAILCDKSTGKDVKFEGAQTGTDFLPSISEKC